MAIVRGGSDPTVPHDGRQSTNGNYYDTLRQQIEFWTRANQIDPTVFVERKKNGDVTQRRYVNKVTKVVVLGSFEESLLHSWPSRYDDDVIAFFKAR